jgi:hypothetical protein
MSRHARQAEVEMTANRFCCIALIGLLAGAACGKADRAIAQSNKTAEVGLFQAGAAAVDITPTSPSSNIAGGFLEGSATRVNDRLYVRAIVLDDRKTKIALVVVDTCMMTQALIDEAKEFASKQCGIAVDHMMVSATHTHSAPAAMGCLGTRQDKRYASTLPAKIVEAIFAADSKREPAKIGWASIDDWEHTHNRRWIHRGERKIVDPFGNASGLAHMHPGYLSPDVIGPSGPVDPGLSVLSVQAKDGRPLAVLANYSQHYFGAEAISADYYGRFSKYIAAILKQPGEGNGPFICAMSQGTSGDLMWMDYGAPQKQLTMDRYAEAVATYAEKALSQVVYHDHVPLKIVERKLKLNYRAPDEARLAWARPIASKIENDLPKNLPEVYAREALILHERQSTELKLQAIRIGDLTISALPNEVYALTGLKLKARSPFAAHFNIELANGAEGYIPTPEQHALGGYTTWPARTAGLEVEAEPKIMETLLGALEEATGKQRREMKDEHGPYAREILAAKPTHYWRLNDADGMTARNAIDAARPAQLQSGFAWYLPGVGSGTGMGAGEALSPSAFSGPNQMNRAVHLAGGGLQTDVKPLGPSWTIALWFWLGERSGASERSGSLATVPNGLTLIANQISDHRLHLQLADEKSEWTGPADQWHFAVLVCDGEMIRVHVDGERKPILSIKNPDNLDTGALRFGAGLQGKLDEIAVFDRALSADDAARIWSAAEIGAQRSQINETPK